VFDTPEFSYDERLEAIKLATDAGYYSDSNNRNSFFDIARDLVKWIQNYLPASMSNRAYLTIKNIYRKHIW
jgi:hypothetical protein